MSDTDLVEAALEIGRGLCATAEPAADGCTWTATIALGGEGDELNLGHGDVGTTLYDGTAGIAVALAACTTAEPGEAFAECALGAARHALASAEQMLVQDRLGLFDGATGVAVGAALVARALHNQALGDEAAGLTARIAAQLLAGPPAGAELDLIGGVAGTMLGLQGSAAALGIPAPDVHALAAALTRAAMPQTWGAAWVTGGAVRGGPPLLGMGHGAAGIALALGEAAADGDDAAATACAQALEYERGWFEPTPPAWPDLRKLGDDGAPVGSMAAWCHGAIGIGLSRVRLAALLTDPRLTAEATAALQAARNLAVQAGTALRAGSLSDCTACHGLAGVVELMLVAARGLGVRDHAQAAKRVVRLMLEQRVAAEGQWPCGLPGAGEVPALMTGTAGIALTLLRAVGAADIATPLLPGRSGW